jgi:hypothetical protein
MILVFFVNFLLFFDDGQSFSNALKVSGKLFFAFKSHILVSFVIVVVLLLSFSPSLAKTETFPRKTQNH